jgi:hypothetical protein
MIYECEQSRHDVAHIQEEDVVDMIAPAAEMPVALREETETATFPKLSDVLNARALKGISSKCDMIGEYSEAHKRDGKLITLSYNSVCEVKTKTIDGHKVHEIELRCEHCSSSFVLSALHDCSEPSAEGMHSLELYARCNSKIWYRNERGQHDICPYR